MPLRNVDAELEAADLGGHHSARDAEIYEEEMRHVGLPHPRHVNAGSPLVLFTVVQKPGRQQVAGNGGVPKLMQVAAAPRGVETVGCKVALERAFQDDPATIHPWALHRQG